MLIQSAFFTRQWMMTKPLESIKALFTKTLSTRNPGNPVTASQRALPRMVASRTRNCRTFFTSRKNVGMRWGFSTVGVK